MATAAQQSAYRDGDVTVRPGQRWQTWQSIDTARLLLLGGTAVLVAISLAHLVGINYPQVAIAFGLFIAFGELLRLALPGGREAAPIAMTAALAFAMVLDIAKISHHQAILLQPLQVVGVTALGMALGALPHVAAGRPAGVTGMSARLVAVAFVAFVFRPLVTADMLHLHGSRYAAAIAFG